MGEGANVQIACDLDNLVPKIATFHIVKGLTFDSVLLPRLTEKAYQFFCAKKNGDICRNSGDM